MVKANMEEMKDKMDKLTRAITTMFTRNAEIDKRKATSMFTPYLGMEILYKDLLLTFKGVNLRMVLFILKGLSQPLFIIGHLVPYKYQFSRQLCGYKPTI